MMYSTFLRIVAPKQRRKKLFEKAHGGCFGGQLRDGKCSRNTIGGPKCDQISFTGVAAVLFVQSEELVDQKFRHSPQ